MVPPAELCQVRLSLDNTDLEVQLLGIKHFIHHIKPPCAKCPYKLGLVHTIVNPCPQCRKNGYQSYERFQDKISGERSGKVRY